MKLVLVTLLLSALTSLAANKVVQKTRVVDEKVVAAEGCSITGEYTENGYSSTEYKYTVTMKIKLLQKQEIYSVNVTKPFFGKAKETPVPNSTKAGPDKTVSSTRVVSFVTRFPTEFNRLALLKACEDESLFINTGAYPPPPPLPVEEPKKPVPVPTTPAPVTPELFPIEVLPGPPAGMPELPTLPLDPTSTSTTKPAEKTASAKTETKK